MLAVSWVAAARGATTQAIADARQAADFAHTRGQLAREVVCLQTATQYGDKSTAARLMTLKNLVKAPVSMRLPHMPWHWPPRTAMRCARCRRNEPGRARSGAASSDHGARTRSHLTGRTGTAESTDRRHTRHFGTNRRGPHLSGLPPPRRHGTRRVGRPPHRIRFSRGFLVAWSGIE